LRSILAKIDIGPLAAIRNCGAVRFLAADRRSNGRPQKMAQASSVGGLRLSSMQFKSNRI
jgi:hypothetical protein